ncbi:MAG TPA: OmpA family protein [Fibrobacteria bacterium]|nr:OmpA family protein [Fibrobacteria bacterium]HOX51063.1 OmpA family protein [Fibrobacteria bacterium]
MNAAESLKNTVGVGVAVGAQHYDGTFGDNTMPYFRGHAEYRPVECLGARLIGGFGNISNGSSEFRTEYFSNIGLQGLFQPKIPALGNVRPYLASGVSTDFGTVKHYGNLDHDLDWNFYLPFELGVEWLINKSWSVTGFAETRVHAVDWDKLDGVVTDGDYFDKRDDLYRAGIGLTWRFGLDSVKAPEPPKVAPVQKIVQEVKPAAVVKVDSDLDGVLDPMDKCAKTPAGVKVDASGCPADSDKDGVADFQDKCASTPAGAKVDATGCPIDSDKDGVADFQDKCASTPAGVKVDAAGCPVDSDKDGVADFQDKCPGTAVGVKVDATGCQEIKIEKGAKLTLEGILFATGKANIDSSSAPNLAQAARAIKAAPASKIEIAGFTDNVGNAAKNKTLSANRAKAVQAYLVKLGVPAKQLTSKGYGPAQPIGDNKTDDGRAKNRRIEFRVK